MYKRWDRWTCTATDEQTLVESCKERTLNPQSARKRPETNSVPGGLNATPTRCQSLYEPAVGCSIKKRAHARVVVVSCSTTWKVKGNERLVTNCRRKTRKDRWELLGASRHWEFQLIKHYQVRESTRCMAVLVLSWSHLFNCLGQCLVAHTNKNGLLLGAEQTILK